MALDNDLALALFGAESDYDPYATSSAGAQGVAQVMPFNTKAMTPGQNPYDPKVSTDNGLTLLHQYYDQFKDPELAVAAYNAGPDPIKKALAKAKDIGLGSDWTSISDPRVGVLNTPGYAETLNHVTKVMDRYSAIKLANHEQNKNPESNPEYNPVAGSPKDFATAVAGIYSSPAITEMDARDKVAALEKIYNSRKWQPGADDLLKEITTNIWHGTPVDERPDMAGAAYPHIAAIKGQTEDEFLKNKELQKSAFVKNIRGAGKNPALFGDLIDKAFDTYTAEGLEAVQTKNRSYIGTAGYGALALLKGAGTMPLSLATMPLELMHQEDAADKLKRGYEELWGSGDRKLHWQTKPDGSILRAKVKSDGEFEQTADGHYIPDDNGKPVPSDWAKNLELIGSIVPAAALAYMSGGASVELTATQQAARYTLLGMNGAMAGDAAYSEARANGGTHLQGVAALIGVQPLSAVTGLLERSAFATSANYLKSMTGQPLKRALAVTLNSMGKGAAGLTNFDFSVYEAAHLATGKGQYDWDRFKRNAVDGALIFGLAGAGGAYFKGEFKDKIIPPKAEELPPLNLPPEELLARQEAAMTAGFRAGNVAEAQQKQAEAAAGTKGKRIIQTTFDPSSTGRAPIEMGMLPSQEKLTAIKEKLEALHNSKADAAVIDLAETEQVPEALTYGYQVDIEPIGNGKARATKRTTFVPNAVDETSIEDVQKGIGQLEKETLEAHNPDSDNSLEPTSTDTKSSGPEQYISKQKLLPDTYFNDLQAKIKEKERLQGVLLDLQKQSPAPAETVEQSPVISETAYPIETKAGKWFLVPHEDKYYVTNGDGVVLSDKGYTYPSDARDAAYQLAEPKPAPAAMRPEQGRDFTTGNPMDTAKAERNTKVRKIESLAKQYRWFNWRNALLGLSDSKDLAESKKALLDARKELDLPERMSNVRVMDPARAAKEIAERVNAINADLRRNNITDSERAELTKERDAIASLVNFKEKAAKAEAKSKAKTAGKKKAGSKPGVQAEALPKEYMSPKEEQEYLQHLRDKVDVLSELDEKLQPRDESGKRIQASTTGATPRGFVKTDPIPNDGTKILSPAQLRASLEDLAETKFVKERMPKNTVGQFKDWIRQVSLKYRNDAVTAWHEMLHRFDDTFKTGQLSQILLEPQAQAIRDSLNALSGGGSGSSAHNESYNLAEGAAELVRGWVTNPDYMQENHPEAVAYMKRKIPAEVLSKLEALGNETRLYEGAPPEKKAAATRYREKDVVNTRTFWEKYNPVKATLRSFYNQNPNDPTATPWDNWRRQMNIQFPILDRLIRAQEPTKRGEALPPVMRALYNILSVTSRAEAQYKGGIIDVNAPARDGHLQAYPGTERGVQGLLEAPKDMGVQTYKEQMRYNEDAWNYGLALTTKRMHEERSYALQQAEVKAREDIAKNRAKQNKFLAARKGKPITSPLPEPTEAAIQAHYDKLTNIRMSGPLTGIAGGPNHESKGTTETEVSDAIINNFNARSPRDKQIINASLKRLQDWGAAALTQARDRGLITDEVLTDLLSKQDTYYPLLKMEREGTFTEKRQGKSIGQAEEVIHSRKGSSAEKMHPVTAMMKITDDILRAGDNAELTERLIDFFHDPRQIYDDNLGNNQVVAEVTAAELAGQDAPNIRSHWRDGQIVYSRWHPDVVKDLDSFKGRSDYGPMTPVLKALHMAAKITKMGVTMWPKYWLFNVAGRDPQERLMYSDAYMKHTITETLKSIGNMANVLIPGRVEKYRKQELEMLRNYGGQSGEVGYTPESYDKALTHMMKHLENEGKTIFFMPKNSMPSLKEIWRASERIGRIAEFNAQYKTAMEKGWDETTALAHAGERSNAIMNFLVGGNLMREVNKLSPFTNVGIQGPRKHFDTMFHGSTLGEKAKSLAAWEAKMALFGIVPMMMIRQWNSSQGKDDEYNKLPWWRRALLWNVAVGDHWLSWPKGFAMIAEVDIMDRLYSHLQGRKHAFEDLPEVLGSQFFPFSESNVAPTGALGLFEALANKNLYTDQDIVSPWEKDVGLAQRKDNPYASEIGKLVQKTVIAAGAGDTWMGKKFGAAEVVDNMLQTNLGYVGKGITAASNIGRDNAQGNKLNAESILGVTRAPSISGMTDIAYIKDWMVTNRISPTNPAAARLRQLTTQFRDAKTNKEKSALIPAVIKEAERVRDGIETRGAQFFGNSITQHASAN